MFCFSSLLRIICQLSVRSWNFFYSWSSVIETIIGLTFLGFFVWLVWFFCVFVQGAENWCGFGESQPRVLCVEFITIYPVVTKGSSLGLCRKADDVQLIKHSLLGWRQDCETWTGLLNVFWESRNNLSMKLIPMTVNHFGMFSNSSRKQINAK